jgi:phosphoribosylformimino-5-aminoimidazole carboxamide ribotide isomerase
VVIDLSCRRVAPEASALSPASPVHEPQWRVGGAVVRAHFIVIDRWQTFTDLAVTPAALAALAPFASEFLVHAADVEGLCQGIDGALVAVLAASPLPVTYAGGARAVADLATVAAASGGRVDLTLGRCGACACACADGSCLDVFGGTVAYADCVAWNSSPTAQQAP